VELSHAVVEAGVYDAPKGSALVLANFTYQPIQALHVRLPVAGQPKSVRSVTHGKLSFVVSPPTKTQPQSIEFSLSLGLNDIVLIE
jgi:hypothetical protein